VVRRLAIVALAGLILAGCGSVSATSAVKSWVTQSAFVANTATLRADVRNAVHQLVNSAATISDRRTVCAVLLLDVEQANSSLPTPDSQASDLLARAYTDLGAGANECYRAGGTAHGRSRAESLLSSGAATLAEGDARLMSLIS
jgi:hypothetical protein